MDLTDRRIRDQQLSTAVNAIRSAPRRSADMAELAGEVVAAFGGTQKFARLLAEQYHDSPSGSPQRTAVMRVVTTLVERYLALTKDIAKVETEMTDDELRDTLWDVWNDLNGTPAPPAPTDRDISVAEGGTDSTPRPGAHRGVPGT